MHKIVSGPDPDDPITHLPHTTAMPKPINRINQTKGRGKYFLNVLFSIPAATVLSMVVTIPCYAVGDGWLIGVFSSCFPNIF